MPLEFGVCQVKSKPLNESVSNFNVDRCAFNKNLDFGQQKMKLETELCSCDLSFRKLGSSLVRGTVGSVCFLHTSATELRRRNKQTSEKGKALI